MILFLLLNWGKFLKGEMLFAYGMSEMAVGLMSLGELGVGQMT